MDRLGLDYNREECAANVTSLQSYIAHNGTAELADTWYDLGRELPGDFFNYLEALSTDAELMANAAYTGGEGSLLPILQKALTDWCPPVRLGGFMDQWASAQSMMRNTNSLKALLADVYNDDPSALMQSYVTNQGNNSSIVNALAAIPYLTPSSLIHAGELHLSWYHSVTLYQQILKYQRIYLASHVIYGSSRLGTKDYLPGQLYSLVDYQQAQPVIDTSILNGRRPWYSGGFNDDIEPGATTVWGNTQTGPFLASERIGEKQYELSNHLGNVQATVSDNRYEVADKSTDSILAYHPALRSAYDYYPFGMLMPGRYVSDTSQHCVTVTRPTWVWKWVISNCHDVYGWVWYNYLKVGRGTATKVDDAILVDLPAATDGVSFDISVTPNVAQALQIDVKSLTMSDGGYIQLLEQNGEDWKKIAEVPVNSGESMVIPFTPNGNVIRVAFWGAMRVYLYTICNARQEWVEEDQLVTICDGDKDKYRFGYNGQEKVNEWSGVGNHNTAKFWEYDTRIGKRLNLDPVVHYSLSPYTTFGDNPIFNVDINGDDTGKVIIPEKKWKNVYRTHEEGLAKNPGLLKPNGHIYLDYDPVRSHAMARRRAAKKGVINPSPESLDIDEFPYASTKQGGANAATNLVPRSENRQHGGYLGWVVKHYNMKNGDVFDIVLIPDKQKQPKPKVVPAPALKPLPVRPIGGYPGQGFGKLISKAIKWITGKDIPIPDPVPVPAPVPAPIPATP